MVHGGRVLAAMQDLETLHAADLVGAECCMHGACILPARCLHLLSAWCLHLLSAWCLHVLYGTCMGCMVHAVAERERLQNNLRGSREGALPNLRVRSKC